MQQPLPYGLQPQLPQPMVICPMQYNMYDPRMMMTPEQQIQNPLILNVQNTPPWIQNGQNLVFIQPNQQIPFIQNNMVQNPFTPFYQIPQQLTPEENSIVNPLITIQVPNTCLNTQICGNIEQPNEKLCKNSQIQTNMEEKGIPDHQVCLNATQQNQANDKIIDQQYFINQHRINERSSLPHQQLIVQDLNLTNPHHVGNQYNNGLNCHNNNMVPCLNNNVASQNNISYAMPNNNGIPGHNIISNQNNLSYIIPNPSNSDGIPVNNFQANDGYGRICQNNNQVLQIQNNVIPTHSINPNLLNNPAFVNTPQIVSIAPFNNGTNATNNNNLNQNRHVTPQLVTMNYKFHAKQQNLRPNLNNNKGYRQDAPAHVKNVPETRSLYRPVIPRLTRSSDMVIIKTDPRLNANSKEFVSRNTVVVTEQNTEQNVIKTDSKSPLEMPGLVIIDKLKKIKLPTTEEESKVSEENQDGSSNRNKILKETEENNNDENIDKEQEFEPKSNESNENVTESENSKTEPKRVKKKGSKKQENLTDVTNCVANKNVTKKYVLTHVLEGLVIQESNVAFPIWRPSKGSKKLNNFQEQCGSNDQNSSNVDNSANLTDIDNANSEDDPFLDIHKNEIETWSMSKLSSHVENYGWKETASIFKEQEMDGKSLLLASKEQLLEVGVAEDHTDKICDFIIRCDCEGTN